MGARLDWLNELSADDANQEFLRCCGSRRWSEDMVGRRPFADLQRLLDAADAAWADLGRDDWLEAFGHHPRIGGDDANQDRFQSTHGWSSDEQSGMASASDSARHRLRAANDAYYDRFGYVFLICATGKSALEMLAEAEKRLCNEPDTEIDIAAEEQRHITRLRLGKLLIT